MKLLYLIIPSLFLPAAGTPHLSRARAEGALPGFGAGFRTGIGSSVTLALQQLSGSAQHSRPAQEQFPAAGGGFWAAAVGRAPCGKRAWLMVGLYGLETFSALLILGFSGCDSLGQQAGDSKYRTEPVPHARTCLETKSTGTPSPSLMQSQHHSWCYGQTFNQSAHNAALGQNSDFWRDLQ